MCKHFQRASTFQLYGKLLQNDRSLAWQISSDDDDGRMNLATLGLSVVYANKVVFQEGRLLCGWECYGKLEPSSESCLNGTTFGKL